MEGTDTERVHPGCSLHQAEPALHVWDRCGQRWLAPAPVSLPCGPWSQECLQFPGHKRQLAECWAPWAWLGQCSGQLTAAAAATSICSPNPTPTSPPGAEAWSLRLPPSLPQACVAPRHREAGPAVTQPAVCSGTIRGRTSPPACRVRAGGPCASAHSAIQLGRDLGSTPGMDGLQTEGADICFRAAGGPSTPHCLQEPPLLQSPPVPRAGLPTTPLSFLTLSAPGARGTTRDPQGGPLHRTYRERSGSDRQGAGAIPQDTALGHLPQSSSEARGWSPSCLHGVHMDDTCPREPSPHP